jgi:hypothetical protein
MCKRFIIKCCAKYFAFFIFGITILVVQSCSLVKIESDQVPLSTTDLNTRLLTQSFVRDAANRVEKAADSILDSSSDIDLQTKSLQWKINTLSSFRKVGFQTSPKLALMDSWTLMLAAEKYFSTEIVKKSFYPFDQVVYETAKNNLKEIDKIAKHLFSEADYIKQKDFAENYAAKYPQKDLSFYHNPVREEYQEFRKLPDSLSLQTVGSLSEVVADLTNKLTYTSENTGKQLQWNTELMLKKNGIDSLKIKQVSDSLGVKFNKLIVLAEESPELFKNALSDFQTDLAIFNERLNGSIVYSMNHLSQEREIVANKLKDERIAIDSIILRERIALSKEAGVLGGQFLDNSMNHLKEIIKTVLGYLILLLAVIIFLPFLIGYYTGKTFSKNKKVDK